MEDVRGFVRNLQRHTPSETLAIQRAIYSKHEPDSMFVPPHRTEKPGLLTPWPQSPSGEGLHAGRRRPLIRAHSPGIPSGQSAQPLAASGAIPGGIWSGDREIPTSRRQPMQPPPNCRRLRAGATARGARSGLATPRTWPWDALGCAGTAPGLNRGRRGPPTPQKRRRGVDRWRFRGNLHLDRCATWLPERAMTLTTPADRFLEVEGPSRDPNSSVATRQTPAGSLECNQGGSCSVHPSQI
jgi:hypothetical protein